MKHQALQDAPSPRKRWPALCTLAILTAFAALFAITSVSVRIPPSKPPHSALRSEVLAAYGKLPLVFEKNLGQTDPRVKFLAHSNGYTLFLTQSQAIFDFGASAPKNDSPFRLVLSGSNASAQIQGADPQSGHTNYLIGNDRSRWQTNVPLYASVRYRNVYPGIDAVYYGNRSQLETDYLVAPGANPAKIALHVEGTHSLALNHKGDVVIAGSSGNVILRRPLVYQKIDGKRREVAANYVLRAPRLVGLEIAGYDSTQPLVVDPVIDYSTYLGGASGTAGGSANNSATAVAVDANGDAYITGSTGASNFPVTSGTFQGQNNSNGALESNAFVTKLNATGTALIYSTYLGGTTSDGATGLAIDSNGDAYVVGTTSSTDFPTISSSVSPIQSTFPPGNSGSTGFFAELDPNGASLLYATYLGGDGTQDSPEGVTVDANGYVYIVGLTNSTTFPVTFNALQAANNSVGANGASFNVFLSRINPAQPGLAGLVYSTYLGGSTNDGGYAIAVDTNANAYIAGYAASSNFPITVNGYQQNRNGSTSNSFLARIDTVNSVLVYSSFLGGGGVGPDQANSIAIDSNSNAYIAGKTYDSVFPTTLGAYETAFPTTSGGYTGYVARFDTSKSGSSSLVYATYLGGNISGDQPHSIAIDSMGNAYLTGETWSGNFPVTPGAPENTGISGLQNGFMTVLTSDGSTVAFSTYFGSNNSAGYGVALDSLVPPDVYIVGSTNSRTFPVTTGSFQTTLQGASDGFVAMLSPAASQGVFANPTTLSFGNQPEGTSSSPQTVTLYNNTQTPLGSIIISIVGTNSSDFGQVNNCPTPASLAAGSSCTITVTFDPSTTSAESATLQIADTDSSSPQTVALTGTGTTPPSGVALTPSSANFGSLTVGIASNPQVFTLTNNVSTALTITGSGVTITGTNAADFAIQANTCPASGLTLAAHSNCTITVVFTPSQTSAESATLSVSDSDASSPQTSALSGTGTAPSGSVTVAPASIAFGNVNVNSTSPAQNATLTNSKTTALTITSVTVVGANASDFTAGSKCGASLAANANCTIAVTFTPTTAAAESATLSIADSDATSPQTVALSGTGVASGPDFTISASPTSASVSTHGTTSVALTVTSLDGFSSPVTLSCNSLPGDAMCSFAQNPLTPAANGTASTTVTITTSAGVFAAAPPSSPARPYTPAWIWMFAISALGFFGMWKMAGRGARRAVCALALLSIAAMASCTGTPSTPKGSYTVALTGQSGSATHNFKFLLTVN